MHIVVPLKKPAKLVERLFDQRPQLCNLMVGWFLRTLTMNYLQANGAATGIEKLPGRLMYYADNPYPTKERSEIVVMRNALAHDVNAGYHNFYNKVVAKVNGKDIGSMKELKTALAIQATIPIHNNRV